MKWVTYVRRPAILPLAGTGIIAAAPGLLPWTLTTIPAIAISLSALPLLTKMARQVWRVRGCDEPSDYREERE